ncbi:MAG: hypothetical protein LIP02_08785 [Bacteroidales bacterium]|nr:hypothetical protein [Bacteroidales bacterium]
MKQEICKHCRKWERPKGERDGLCWIWNEVTTPYQTCLCWCPRPPWWQRVIKKIKQAKMRQSSAN